MPGNPHTGPWCTIYVYGGENGLALALLRLCDFEWLFAAHDLALYS